MFFPRFTAVAETGWTDNNSKNLADFQRRFAFYTKILSEIGITPAPEKEWNPNVFGRISKTLSFFGGVLKRKS